jgi:hypothetical protein
MCSPTWAAADEGAGRDDLLSCRSCRMLSTGSVAGELCSSKVQQLERLRST